MDALFPSILKYMCTFFLAYSSHMPTSLANSPDFLHRSRLDGERKNKVQVARYSQSTLLRRFHLGYVLTARTFGGSPQALMPQHQRRQ